MSPQPPVNDRCAPLLPHAKSAKSDAGRLSRPCHLTAEPCFFVYSTVMELKRVSLLSGQPTRAARVLVNSKGASPSIAGLAAYIAVVLGRSSNASDFYSFSGFLPLNR